MWYSVSIYKDTKGNILVIPDGFDQHGIRRDLDIFKRLERPHSTKVLGQTVRECLQISKDTPVIQDVESLGKVFQIATGIKSWTKFAREHIYVGGRWNPEKGYEFSPLKRKGTSYLGEKGDPKVELSLDASNEEIGEAIIKAFSFLE